MDIIGDNFAPQWQMIKICGSFSGTCNWGYDLADHFAVKWQVVKIIYNNL